MSKQSIWNIPNLLSILRIVMIPAFIVLFFKGGAFLYYACGVLVLSGLTDMLDGIIARRCHQITAVGQVLDPIADKMTQVAVGICMMIYYFDFPSVVSLFALFFLKELLMGAGGLVLFIKKKRPIPAQWYGKVATVAFYISVVLMVLLQALAGYSYMWITWILVGITALFMINAFARYVLVFREILRGDYVYEDNPPRA